MLLFALTIVTAVCFHYFMHLPPAIGMVTGLSYLAFFGYYTKRKVLHCDKRKKGNKNVSSFDIMEQIANAEWDTLLFFYGVMLCVGGLATIGYLDNISTTMFSEWGSRISCHT